MVGSSDSKLPSIPDWQKSYTGSSSAQKPEAHPDPDISSTVARGDPVDQAKLLLEDQSAKDGSREEKVALLKKNGLKDEEIQRLLGEEPELKVVHDSTNSSPGTSEPSSSPPASNEAQTSLSSTSPRDIPPIITYPEFLLRPNKPPPLITFQRLAYVTYAVAGLSTLAYGASNFLVQPMIESLTSARHDFAENAIENLEKLNTRLEKNVSHVPYVNTKHLKHDEADVESIVSDPTELFHRDIATQTTPQLGRADSWGSLNSGYSHTGSAQNEDSTTEKQAKSLARIHASLSSLHDSLAIPDEFSAASDLKARLDSLNLYLDDVKITGMSSAFSPSSYDHLSSGYDLSQHSKLPRAGKDKKAATEKKEEDEVEKFKAEIRAVKGALLSSRTFPAGKPGSMSMGIPGAAPR